MDGWMDGEDLSEANWETGTWSSSLMVFDRVFRPELEEQPSIEKARNALVPSHRPLWRESCVVIGVGWNITLVGFFGTFVWSIGLNKSKL